MDAKEKYVLHLESCGLDTWGRTGDEVRADCPWCAKPGHLYYNVQKCVFKCFYCDEQGHRWHLLDHLAETMAEPSGSVQLRKLADFRRLPVEAFGGYGIGYEGGQYHIPIRMRDGSLTDLRRYRLGGNIMSAPGAHAGLFGVDKLSDPELDNADIFLCEGEWDAIAMAYLLRCAGHHGVALGTPGAGTFRCYWSSYFRGRTVYIAYDNDPPGQRGVQKVSGALKGYAKSIKRFAWSESASPGEDINDLVAKAVG